MGYVLVVCGILDIATGHFCTMYIVIPHLGLFYKRAPEQCRRWIFVLDDLKVLRIELLVVRFCLQRLDDMRQSLFPTEQLQWLQILTHIDRMDSDIQKLPHGGYKLQGTAKVIPTNTFGFFSIQTIDANADALEVVHKLPGVSKRSVGDGIRRTTYEFDIAGHIKKRFVKCRLSFSLKRYHSRYPMVRNMSIENLTKVIIRHIGIGHVSTRTVDTFEVAACGYFDLDEHD